MNPYFYWCQFYLSFSVTGTPGVGTGPGVGGVAGADYAAYTSPYTQYSPAAAAYSAYGYGSGGIISKYISHYT